MKKLTYFSALALGLALVACDDYKEPNPPAQSNEAPEVLMPADLGVTGQIVAGQNYNLEDYNNANQPITIATVMVNDLQPGYQIGALGEISASTDFSTTTYPITLEVMPATRGTQEFDVVVYADELQGVYSNISMAPTEATIGIRFNLTATNATETAYLGENGEAYEYAYSMTFTPIPSDVPIEDAYYLLGTINGWSVAEAVPFTHVGTGNVYDFPEFQITVDITEEAAAAGWWWKIIPASTYAYGDWMDTDYSQWGVAENGDTSLTGTLVPRKDGQDPGAGDITEAGKWVLTINMVNLTYEFSAAPSYLYTPGDANGWNQEASQLLYPTGDTTYEGYAALSVGGFKFTSQADWDGVNYGSTGVEGELTTDPGAGNLSVDVTGLYWCTVDTEALTYSATYVSTYGLIGDATPGGWDASTALTPSEDFVTWSAVVTLGDGEFKFRANDGWDINLGGSMENLTPGGDNIASPGAGTYKVTLNLGQLPYSCTFEAQ